MGEFVSQRLTDVENVEVAGVVEPEGTSVTRPFDVE
jgi:hypothetical protein